MRKFGKGGQNGFRVQPKSAEKDFEERLDFAEATIAAR
jgi:hypothetical protein